VKPSDQTATNTLLFRPDISPAIGTGHLMRCLALAELCMEQGKQVVFAVNGCPAALADRIRGLGAGLQPLADQADPGELAALARRLRAIAIVLDGYHFSERYRAAVAELGLPVVAIDDGTVPFALHADIVVNTSPLARATDYADIARGSRLLLGPSYAPLRREFRHGPAGMPQPAPEDAHILLTFGGSDPAGLTLPVARALLDTLPAAAKLDIVIGGALADVTDIEQLVRGHADRVRLHRNTTRMAKLMRRATLAVTAAGSTLWELAYLTVPTIAVVVADNQAGNLQPPLLDWFRTIDARDDVSKAVNQVAAATLALWEDAQERSALSRLLRSIEVATRTPAICEAIDSTYARPA
jgi:UDP-2,4-diacetamido-2,4,6-trideoxy-beta-L-altropyranose hydrolase